MFDLSQNTEQVVCCVKGMIYRYKESMFINNRGDWGRSQRMVLQKRLSCSCQDNGITELLSDLPYDVQLPTTLKDGCLYQLIIGSDSMPYEGYDVDCWPQFIKVTKEQNNGT